jgi:oxygen-dependent protoporphyrinogen oxidase
MLACTFVQAKFDHRVPEDKVVFRCFLGGAGNERVLDRADDDLLDAVLRELHGLLGWRAEPLFTRITRWRRAMAQYTVGHSERLKEIHARVDALPGLALAGNAYDGIGIPDCIRLGREAARRLTP